jgi:hypothetical protein
MGVNCRRRSLVPGGVPSSGSIVMSALPKVDDPIVLRNAAGGAHLSRVEGAESDVLSVVRPTSATKNPDRVELGDELELSWISPRGVGVVDVRVAEEFFKSTGPLWHLEVLAEPSFLQRREHVRVAIAAPMTLEARSVRSGTITADLIDVGEAALRCAVHDRSLELALTEGVPVVTHFALGEVDFDIAGAVLMRRPAATPEEVPEIVVSFEQSADEQDTLRHHVFAQQLLARRPARA